MGSPLEQVSASLLTQREKKPARLGSPLEQARASLLTQREKKPARLRLRVDLLGTVRSEVDEESGQRWTREVLCFFSHSMNNVWGALKPPYSSVTGRMRCRMERVPSLEGVFCLLTTDFGSGSPNEATIGDSLNRSHLSRRPEHALQGEPDLCRGGKSGHTHEGFSS
jgi:hypothetical protein